MSQQIRLRRAQDKRFQRTSDLTTADFIIPIGASAKQQLQQQQQYLDNNNLSSSSFESDTTTTSPLSNLSSSLEDNNNNSSGVLNMITNNQDRLITDEVKNLCYFCQKCKNHGLMIWKKVKK